MDINKLTDQLFMFLKNNDGTADITKIKGLDNPSIRNMITEPLIAKGYIIPSSSEGFTFTLTSKGMELAERFH
jgi:predicted transcriptional regulator